MRLLKHVDFMNRWALGPTVSSSKNFEFSCVFQLVFTKNHSLNLIIIMLSEHLA